MITRRSSLTAVIVLLVLGAAVAESPSHPARAQVAQQIAIQSYAFAPATVTVPAGATVTWTNLDTVGHTSTSTAGSAVSWDSGALAQGQSFSVTFTQPGTFTYFCTIHPFMNGTIVVQAAGGATLTAAPAPTATPAPSPTPTVAQHAPTATPVSRSRPKRRTITIKHSGNSYAFAPARLTVKVGTRVTWSNLSDAPHTVTGRGSWKFASKLFNRNHSVGFTFKKTGTYRYYCAVHPYMKGTIIVSR